MLAQACRALQAAMPQLSGFSFLLNYLHKPLHLHAEAWLSLWHAEVHAVGSSYAMLML